MKIGRYLVIIRNPITMAKLDPWLEGWLDLEKGAGRQYLEDDIRDMNLEVLEAKGSKKLDKHFNPAKAAGVTPVDPEMPLPDNSSPVEEPELNQDVLDGDALSGSKIASKEDFKQGTEESVENAGNKINTENTELIRPRTEEEVEKLVDAMAEEAANEIEAARNETMAKQPTKEEAISMFKTELLDIVSLYKIDEHTRMSAAIVTEYICNSLDCLALANLQRENEQAKEKKTLAGQIAKGVGV